LKPHGYRLCEVHWSRGKCYFERLPLEVRLEIYRHLIPDEQVLARRYRQSASEEKSAPIFPAILAVNKTIHEEVADLLYGRSTFEIDVVQRYEFPIAHNGVFMCRVESAMEAAMARMLPAELNRHRRLDGQLQDMVTDPAEEMGVAPPRPSLFTPWEPVLSQQNFKRIQSFVLNITLRPPWTHDNVGGPTQDGGPNEEEIERNLLCDNLHQLVDRLIRGSRCPQRSFDIRVFIEGKSNVDDALNEADLAMVTAHCQALLFPLQRLRAYKASIECFVGSTPIDTLAFRPEGPSSLDIFLDSCVAQLTNVTVPVQRSAILQRFLNLAFLIMEMCKHPGWDETDFEEFKDLLHRGRQARENDNPAAMMALVEQASQTLGRFNARHQSFMLQMGRNFMMARSVDGKK
jgi:hypothetical protein